MTVFIKRRHTVERFLLPFRFFHDALTELRVFFELVLHFVDTGPIVAAARFERVDFHIELRLFQNERIIRAERFDLGVVERHFIHILNGA